MSYPANNHNYIELAFWGKRCIFNDDGFKPFRDCHIVERTGASSLKHMAPPVTDNIVVRHRGEVHIIFYAAATSISTLIESCTTRVS